MIRTHTFTLHVVRCDGCGNQNRTLSDGFHYEQDAVHAALDSGWQLIDEQHYCKGCQ
jgi:hypothetical protein